MSDKIYKDEVLKRVNKTNKKVVFTLTDGTKGKPLNVYTDKKGKEGVLTIEAFGVLSGDDLVYLNQLCNYEIL